MNLEILLFIPAIGIIQKTGYRVNNITTEARRTQRFTEYYLV